jgi:hypothetical protein
MDVDCLILVPEISPRIIYTFRFMLEENLGLKMEITDDLESYVAFEGIRINYTNKRQCEQEVVVPSAGLLFEKGIRSLDIEVSKTKDIPFFFKVSVSQSDLDFDIPAMIFFQLSRYEEYWPFQGDQYGRFTAAQSIAGKHGFLRKSVVNIWLDLFKKEVKARFPGVVLTTKKYHFQPTYDIDLAWAFRNRGIRSMGGWVKDLIKLNLNNLHLRNDSRSDKTKDPFYTFEYLKDLHNEYGLNPIWFFLLGNYGGVDKSISWKNPEFRQLIRQVAAPSNIGIHPSFASSENFELLEKEVFKLGVIKKSTVHRSRQHYLMLSFPNTYRQLIRAGIREDFSLGYADDIGFRSGFAGDYFWYDLEAEKTTLLRLYPFQVMDVTLKNYLKLRPEEAIEQVDAIVQQVRKYGGTFSSLWHNSSFASSHGWEGWEMVYKALIKVARE